jgi:hypothetical protein
MAEAIYTVTVVRYVLQTGVTHVRANSPEQARERAVKSASGEFTTVWNPATSHVHDGPHAMDIINVDPLT